MEDGHSGDGEDRREHEEGDLPGGHSLVGQTVGSVSRCGMRGVCCPGVGWDEWQCACGWQAGEQECAGSEKGGAEAVDAEEMWHLLSTFFNPTWANRASRRLWPHVKQDMVVRSGETGSGPWPRDAHHRWARA